MESQGEGGAEGGDGESTVCKWSIKALKAHVEKEGRAKWDHIWRQVGYFCGVGARVRGEGGRAEGSCGKGGARQVGPHLKTGGLMGKGVGREGQGQVWMWWGEGGLRAHVEKEGRTKWGHIWGQVGCFCGGEGEG